MEYPVIFTDLDGTLIDFVDYSFDTSKKSVQKIQEAGIPVIFCSSKTKAEQAYYLKELAIKDPFIVENGSAIFVPKGYFSFEIADLVPYDEAYDVIVLGSKYDELRKSLTENREELGIEALGYGDLSLAEVMQIIKLDETFSKRAADREFSETILKLGDGEERFNLLKSRLWDDEISCLSGGKFHTLMSNKSDKGKAIQVLVNLYCKEKQQEIRSIGIGDSANDASMLSVVDLPYQVQKPPGLWSEMGIYTIRKINKIGPEGWNQMAKEVLEMFSATVQ